MGGRVVRIRVLGGGLGGGKEQGVVDVGDRTLDVQRPIQIGFRLTTGEGTEQTQTKTRRSGNVGGSSSSSDSNSGNGSAFGISGITSVRVCTILRGRSGEGRGEEGVVYGWEEGGSREGRQVRRHRCQGRRRGRKDEGRRGIVSRGTLASSAGAGEHRRSAGGGWGSWRVVRVSGCVRWGSFGCGLGVFGINF